MAKVIVEFQKSVLAVACTTTEPAIGSKNY